MSQNDTGDGTVLGGGMNHGNGNGSQTWDPQGAVRGVKIPTFTPFDKQYNPMGDYSHDWEIDDKTGIPIRRRKLF